MHFTSGSGLCLNIQVMFPLWLKNLKMKSSGHTQTHTHTHASTTATKFLEVAHIRTCKLSWMQECELTRLHAYTEFTTATYHDVHLNRTLHTVWHIFWHSLSPVNMISLNLVWIGSLQCLFPLACVCALRVVHFFYLSDTHWQKTICLHLSLTQVCEKLKQNTATLRTTHRQTNTHVTHTNYNGDSV